MDVAGFSAVCPALCGLCDSTNAHDRIEDHAVFIGVGVTILALGVIGGIIALVVAAKTRQRLNTNDDLLACAL